MLCLLAFFIGNTEGWLSIKTKGKKKFKPKEIHRY